jgi:hypothetical protein
VDDAAWAARTAREKVILWGLVDWVELERVHDFVAAEHQGAPVSEVQNETLGLIRSLVTDGLFVIGDLAGPDRRFAPWHTTLDESLHRIRGEYVDRFDDATSWPWFCWLDLTDEGKRVAESLEAD